jgi:hypothetical protein
MWHEVICVNNDSCSQSLTVGREYFIRPDMVPDMFILAIDDKGRKDRSFFTWRFRTADKKNTLPAGWMRCQCGTLTKNIAVSRCCDCTPKK